MQIKNGVIIDGIVYERILGENVSLRRIGKLKDILLYEHEDIDLGLSVKWASCNIGAEEPSDYGDYYAWGEIEPNLEYTKENCKTWLKGIGCIAGNPKFDAARASWGDPWRMPTQEEVEELINKCKCEWTIHKGHKGCKITGPNGNSIFLPTAGWRSMTSLNNVGKSGNYWSATPDEDDTDYACSFDFNNGYFDEGWSYRYYGLSVRPVTE